MRRPQARKCTGSSEHFPSAGGSPTRARAPGAQPKRIATVTLLPVGQVWRLCVSLRAQAMASWQSPHTSFRPGFPHAAALH